MVNNSFDLPDFSSKASKPLKAELPRDYTRADYAYEVIMERIKEFEDGLDEEHEVGLMLASFGESVTLAVTEIGYSNPTTLVFHGRIKGKNATLIQHLSQLNFLLVAVSRSELNKPPRRIGFEQPIAD